MTGEEMRKGWSVQSEDMLSGMLEWRLQHPEASFREIEEEVDQLLSVMRAKMLAEAAVYSAKAEWNRNGIKPSCPKCGKVLVKKGKKKRKLQTRGGQEVELEREYGICPECGQGIFPPR
jgi:YgiT-type zinc finger domain-containing protein